MIKIKYEITHKLGNISRWSIVTGFGSDTGKSYGRYSDAKRGLARMLARM